MSSIDRRIEAAMSELMHAERAAPGVYRVHSSSGGSYYCDPWEPACTCEWWQYNHEHCKHCLRVFFEHGIPPVV